MHGHTVVSEESQKVLGEYKLTRDDKNKKKVELPHWELGAIGYLGTEFMNIERLYLSYNYLTSLDGIHNLPNLTHLSLVYNQLIDWQEFQKIKLKSKLKMLAVHSNPLCKHPDYRRNLVSLFPNLQVLDDDQKLTPSLRQRSSHLSTRLSKRLLPFLHLVSESTTSLGSNPQLSQDTISSLHCFFTSLHIQQRVFMDVNRETEFFLDVIDRILLVVDKSVQGFQGVVINGPNSINKLYREVFRELLLAYVAEGICV